MACLFRVDEAGESRGCGRRGGRGEGEGPPLGFCPAVEPEVTLFPSVSAVVVMMQQWHIRW